MKIVYVVQRYGPEILGGAEATCRAFAERLATRGWDVDVFTTCAKDYRSWRNEYRAGTERDGAVTVHRFPSIAERPQDFDEFCNEVLADPDEVSTEVQERWMRAQGPEVPDLVTALRDRHPEFDLVVFVTYLYYTTYHGLPAASERAVLQPTAHDEPPIYLPIFDERFRIPKAFVFYTTEEQNFVHERFELRRVPELVAGIGVDASTTVDAERGRARLGVQAPYVLYLGRVDPSKGMEHLWSFFGTYRERRGDAVELVLAGDPVVEVPPTPGVRVVGTLDDQEKWDALAGAELCVQPSFYESFAMTLLESWRVGVPAVVNGFCDVTVGHCRRADGGVWYRSYAEFEACLDRLLNDAELRTLLGRQGRLYVEANYGWDDVINRYAAFLESVRSAL